MEKKVIRLTESDLTKIVRRVLVEQTTNYTLQTAAVTKGYDNAKTKNYRVTMVNGKPVIVKNGKRLLITKGMTITPADSLQFNVGDYVDVQSVSPEDKGKYFQQVRISFDNNRLTLNVFSN